MLPQTRDGAVRRVLSTTNDVGVVAHRFRITQRETNAPRTPAGTVRQLFIAVLRFHCRLTTPIIVRMMVSRWASPCRRALPKGVGDRKISIPLPSHKLKGKIGEF